ncbi:MAG: hypothetical protein Q8K72_08390 [Acidimicrobiales bacterium]|nr:hypothetical protein [Acidimicrobiales bacterium]
MTQHSELTPADLEAEGVAALPDREAMSLLDLSANLDLALDIAAPIDAAVAANANVAAPIDAAVAANANVAAPIDAAVAANILSVDSEATAVAEQDSIIIQDLDGTAIATADQDATIQQ